MSEVLPVSVPPQEAVDYFRAKGYQISFAWEDVYAEEHALSFTVAKAMQIDILEDIRAAVDQAIADGGTLQEFSKQLKPTLAKKGWWGEQLMTDPATGEERVVQLGSPRRLNTIFDTNIRTSYSAGNWERAQRTKDTYPYLRYRHLDSGHPRPQHAAWNNLVLRIDDAFWISHYPPNGWGCHCGAQQLSDRDLERYGYQVSTAPASPTREWINPRTGEAREVPVGIDPGFDYNPGSARARADQLRQTLESKLKAADPELAAAVRATPNS